MTDNPVCNKSEQYQLSTWLFLRLLSVTLLFAFVCTAVQIHGLIGSQGIVPISSTIARFEQQTDVLPAWLIHPTLFWFSTSDAFLNVVLTVGICASILAVVGVFTPAALLVEWIAYGSIAAVGSDFYSFQWDSMLLESTFLALFLIPLRRFEPPLVKAPYAYSMIINWLLRWLFFRVWFGSAIVKLLSDSPYWRDCTALQYYYETQLLPAYLGWYVHRIPAWMHTMSVATGLLIELVGPFCIFAPRKIRIVAVFVMAALQMGMFATGNHGFINTLTIVLSISLLDDQFLRRFFPAKFVERFEPASPPRGLAPAYKWAAVGAVVVFLLLSTGQFAISMGGAPVLPRLAMDATRCARNHHILGGYGLYPIIFTQRTELLVEGSPDGQTWRPYAFRYKIDDPNKPPPFAFGYQPRLDWRMRFAAGAGKPSATPWIYRFVNRLLVGSKPVLSLIEAPPFGEQPPRFIRVKLCTFRYTTPEEKAATGQWWHREEIAPFIAPYSLSSTRN